MLDLIYGNIGRKIKTLAIVVFVIETLAALLGGFLMFFDDFLTGVLIILVTPIVAWISSWTLYAFGELVEKTTQNESNTREILKIMKQNNTETTATETPKITLRPSAPPLNKTTSTQPKPESNKKEEKTIPISTEPKQTTFINDIASQTIICSACKTRQPIGRKLCWHCGASFISEASNDNT